MSSGLKGRFMEATNSFPRPHTEANASVLYRTPWVRILVEPHEVNDDASRIEVEVFLSNQSTDEETNSSDLIDKLTNHLEYLRRLHDLGFEVCVIGSGCIMCASKVVVGTPMDNLFSALLPP